MRPKSSNQEPFPRVVSRGAGGWLWPGTAGGILLGLCVVLGAPALSPGGPAEASLCWEKEHSPWEPAGVAEGLEDNPWGQEGRGGGMEAAHVRSLWDQREAGVGPEANLSFLNVEQVRNLFQLEVAREHQDLKGKEIVELNEISSFNPNKAAPD